jgi:hypothetical protein
MQWSLPAFNRALRLLLVPAVDWCGTYKKSDALTELKAAYIDMGGMRENGARVWVRGDSAA